jgi:curved DNA-binding protein CbpA
VTDYYAILGVSRNATPEELKAARDRHAKALHPDVNPFGQELMALVNEAYGTLSNPAKRRAYDLKQKVTEFPQQTAARVIKPDGSVDLIGLVNSVLPQSVSPAFKPVLERYLDANGITPNAATLAEALQAVGWLPKKRGRRRSA